jgi:hypothetical protein
VQRQKLLSGKRITATLDEFIDAVMYKWRHMIGNSFAKIKEFREFATRYDKTDVSFRANFNLIATLT